MMKRKAQMQGGETIAVVVIVVILIMIGVSFGVNRQITDIEQEGKKLDYQKAIQVALKAADMQELKCSSANSIGNTCLDKYKVRSMGQVIKDNPEAYLYYQGIFENTEIKIEVLHPPSTKKNYTIYNFNDTINKTRVATYIPVIVQDPINNIKSFAVMEVATYS